ncbi:MAG: rhomboid family intramembrane serine protease [Rhizobiales bacterium]|nr:rhomboid family intramembrane serine protease [Hyphomicrobiales bacterium]
MVPPLVSSREPMFNVPPVVLATIAVLVLVHLVRVYGLDSREDVQLLLTFAFIPARFESGQFADVLPGGFGAEIWTFFTYALFHGDASHLGLNAIWLLAFGSAVARRFGALRFVLFFAITAAAGAAAHLVAHPRGFVPVIGASAAISGCMAAAIRFVFQAGGPLGVLRGEAAGSYRQPAPPLLVVLRDPRVMLFLAMWFGLNLLFGIGSISVGESDQAIAWEAHIGGFLAGLLLFPLFDPVGRYGSRSDHDPDEPRFSAER